VKKSDVFFFGLLISALAFAFTKDLLQIVSMICILIFLLGMLIIGERENPHHSWVE